MCKNINIDYIGVVKENNGEYKFEQVPIIESIELKRQLRAMCKNPNRTLLDMQDAFAMQIKTDERDYDCCLPHTYLSAYIDYVRYPKFKTYDAYQTDRDANIKDITALVNTYVISEDDKAKRIKDKIQEYDQLLKDSFLSKAIRYIEAMDFTATREHLNTLDSVKMSSHEFIGWTSMKYRINEDLTITVNSNFGYGASSYFFVNVCYKGVDLLLYSDTVNYYYANMQDIIANTRSYLEKRESWQHVLNDVACWSDKTRGGIEQFAYEWLKNEITEMMDRLQHIKREPKLVLDNIIGNSSEREGLVSVRNITADEIQTYKAYPDELALIFKVEKISNALALLAKLKEASIIYEDAISAIEEIKELNITIAPEIQEAIERLNNEITALKEQKLAPIELELSEIDDLPIKKRVNEVYEWLQKRTSISRDKLDNLYAKKLPGYAAVIDRINKLKERRSKIKTEINDRRRFMERLQKCYTNIADASLLAA